MNTFSSCEQRLFELFGSFFLLFPARRYSCPRGLNNGFLAGGVRDRVQKEATIQITAGFAAAPIFGRLIPSIHPHSSSPIGAARTCAHIMSTSTATPKLFINNQWRDAA